jgi:outer membrane protein TolC
MMKKILLVIWSILFCFKIAAQPLSLQDAVDIALHNNYKIKQFNEKYEQKKYEDLSAWGNFLPKINLTGSYTHLNEPLDIDLSPIRDVLMNLQAKNQTEFANVYNILQGKAPLSDQQRNLLFQGYYNQLNNVIPPFSETYKKQDFWSATLTGVQPIFMGGKLLAAKNYSSDEKQSSVIELQKTKDEITEEVVNNYITVVLIKDIISTRMKVLDGMRYHEQKADKLLKEGLIANYNYLRAKVAVADAERNLFDEKNKYDLAVLNLLTTLGTPEDSKIQINDSLSFVNGLDSVFIYQNSMAQSQPVLKIIELKQDEANLKYKSEFSKLLPQVAAFGKYEMIPQYLSPLEPRWTVGIQASLNIFNGFQDYLSLQTASHLESEVKYLQSDTKSKLELLVNKNYKDAANAEERYLKLNETIKLAEENLRLNNKRFETGLGTSIEVIDANLELEKNLIESKLSLYEYYQKLTALYTIAGIPNDIIKIWQKDKR